MAELSDRYTVQICRLCLARTVTCFSLLENCGASGMLEALTSLRILPSDEISTVMCLKCHLNLKLAFTIQQNMLKAEQEFRNQNFLIPIKQENSEVMNDYSVDLNISKSTTDVLSKIHWICDICGVSKSTKRNLSHHKYNVHKNRKCPNCVKEIKLSKYKQHVDNCTGKKSILVKIEPVILESNINPEEDSIIMPKLGIPTCDICGAVKSSMKNLTHHKYNVHRFKNCPKCEKNIKLTRYKQHVDNCTGIKEKDVKILPVIIEQATIELEEVLKTKKLGIYTCDICGAVKSSKKNLSHHRYNVHMFKKCPKCERNIKLTKYKQHVENCGIKRKKVVKDEKCDDIKPKYYGSELVRCPLCNKQLRKTNLRRHIERHTDDNFTVCELCGKSVRSQDLRSHNYYNHQNHSYKCSFCEKTYKKKDDMLYHEKRQHLGEANFVCDTCGKKFYKNSFLKKHIEMTHLKLRPYICEFCNVGFSSRFALRTHRRQHTNETPYKCDICSEGFRQNVSLRSHLKSKHNIHEELICECKICGKKFASDAALMSHKRVH